MVLYMCLFLLQALDWEALSSGAWSASDLNMLNGHLSISEG